MKRKIVKYLNSKDKSQYLKVDFIFEDYLSGRLKQLLIDRGFDNVEIFYDIHRKNRESGLTIDCKYQHLVIWLSFWESNYCQGIYTQNCSVEETDKNTEILQYEDNFTIDKYLDHLCITLNDKK